MSYCLSVSLSVFVTLDLIHYLCFSLSLDVYYMSECFSVCLAVYLSACLSVRMSVYLLVCLSVCLRHSPSHSFSLFLSISQCLLFVCLPSCLSACKPVCPTCPSVCVCVYLSICPPQRNFMAMPDWWHPRRAVPPRAGRRDLPGWVVHWLPREEG